jgi:hypothetical protein
MKRPRLLAILHALSDKRLYGFGFVWRSAFLLCWALALPSYAFALFSWPLLSVYVMVFLLYFFTSGLCSKNILSEFQAMQYWQAFLLLMVGSLAFGFSFVARVESTIFGQFQMLVVLMLSVIALLISITEITVSGQRLSLRQSIGLTDNFIDTKKEFWKKELEGFPNSENIVECLDSGRYVRVLFDRGSFNLAVLWCCNVMEEIIDATAEGIISKDPLKKPLFKNEKVSSQRYPTQLKNLNYVHLQKTCRKTEQLSIDDLWDKKRNAIAHHHYIPTFDETYGALIIFVSFVEEFPKTLQH